MLLKHGCSGVLCSGDVRGAGQAARPTGCAAEGDVQSPFDLPWPPFIFSRSLDSCGLLWQIACVSGAPSTACPTRTTATAAATRSAPTAHSSPPPTRATTSSTSGTCTHSTPGGSSNGFPTTFHIRRCPSSRLFQCLFAAFQCLERTATNCSYPFR